MLTSISLFLHETLAGKFIFTLLVSILPVLELRGGIPIGVSMGLSVPAAFLAALIGNMIPVPFVIIFIRRIFHWVRAHIPSLSGWIRRLEQRAYIKGEKVRRYEMWGLLILVAIPLPGTGAWTGSLIAALLNLRLKRAVPTIFLGVLIAGLLTTAITYGAILAFE